MEPHGSVDVVMALGQLHGGAGGIQITARIEDQPDAELGQGVQQGVPILIKPAGIVVGMCVKIQRISPPYKTKSTEYSDKKKIP